MGSESNKKGKCLKKSNLLVYQQPTGQRTERKEDLCKKGVKIPICNPKPKQIKICTGAELRKMCPPNVCPCDPPKKSRFGIFKLLGFGAKSAVAAAAIYITYDMGIWGTTDETQDLYNTACHLFGSPKPKRNDKWDPPSCEAESELFSRPGFDPYGHCGEPPLRAEDTYLRFKRVWNAGVSAVFHGIANFPGNVLRNGDSQSSELQNKEPLCVPYSQLDEQEQDRVKNQYK